MFHKDLSVHSVHNTELAVQHRGVYNKNDEVISIAANS